MSETQETGCCFTNSSQENSLLSSADCPSDSQSFNTINGKTRETQRITSSNHLQREKQQYSRLITTQIDPNDLLNKGNHLDLSVESYTNSAETAQEDSNICPVKTEVEANDKFSQVLLEEDKLNANEFTSITFSQNNSFFDLKFIRENKIICHRNQVSSLESFDSCITCSRIDSEVFSLSKTTSTSLPVLNYTENQHRFLPAPDQIKREKSVPFICFFCQQRFFHRISSRQGMGNEKEALLCNESNRIQSYGVINDYDVINPLTYNSTREERPEFGRIRRALSCSSSYPDVRIGRTRKLFCPRQPPTTLQRTLSISRTSLSKRQTRRLSTYQKRILFCLSFVSFTS